MNSPILFQQVPIHLAGERADRIASALFEDHSRVVLARAIEEGRLTVDGATVKPKLRLKGGETLRLDGLDIEVWGRPHTEAVLDFSPFSSPPPRGEAPWQIGIGHGHYIHPRAVMEHSFHIREEHLAATERDYVALGHWEQMTRVAAGERVVAAYSGCPEGLAHRKGGWVLLVDLMEDGGVQLTAHPLGEEPGMAHHEIPLLLGA